MIAYCHIGRCFVVPCLVTFVGGFVVEEWPNNLLIDANLFLLFSFFFISLAEMAPAVRPGKRNGHFFFNIFLFVKICVRIKRCLY